jgi:hypothetical protein
MFDLSPEKRLGNLKSTVRPNRVMAQVLGRLISLRYPAEYGEKPASPLTMALFPDRHSGMVRRTRPGCAILHI